MLAEVTKITVTVIVVIIAVIVVAVIVVVVIVVVVAVVGRSLNRLIRIPITTVIIVMPCRCRIHKDRNSSSSRNIS